MELPYTFSNQELAWIQALSALSAFLALLFSFLAVYFTARTYWQKTGNLVRGNYSIISSDVATNDQYVKEVTLENLKDRSIVIFGIYLRLSINYIVELERFDESPLVLKPFEVVRRKYDPVDGYSFNLKRIDLNKLFSGSHKTINLVLSTPDGKLEVRKSGRAWNPMYEWFKNHLIITAGVDRTLFENHAYGANALFLVRLFKNGEKIRSIPIYPREHNYRWFHELGGTKESMESIEKLTAVFERAVRSGKIQADAVDVIDVQDVLQKRYKDYNLEPIIAEKHSWFFVRMVGPIVTRLHSLRLIPACADQKVSSIVRCNTVDG